MNAGGLIDRLRWPLTVLLAAVAVGGSVLLLREPAPPLVVTPATAVPRELQVYVSGAVAQPGVYRLREGDRVADALQAAGGPSAEADLDRLNLSLRLRDEMHVQVPTKAPSEGQGGPAGPGSDLINLNTATEAQLDTLPGIGPVTAQRIIEHRERNGPFQRIEELLESRIVSSSTFDRIKSRITAP